MKKRSIVLLSLHFVEEIPDEEEEHSASSLCPPQERK